LARAPRACASATPIWNKALTKPFSAHVMSEIGDCCAKKREA
jgi:hypothetical protein